jgi:release factor H-coupled RctB family protein
MGTSPSLGVAESFILDGPGVYVDPEAQAQLERVSKMPGCTRAVGMPDLHPGRGIPIGVASAFRGCIHPALVGSDAGCGVTLTLVHKVAAPAKRRRRIERMRTPTMNADPLVLLDAAWRGGPRALAEVAGLPESFATWVARTSWGDAGPVVALPETLKQEVYARALGTVGGGNHFLELARVEAVFEPDALDGLRPGAYAVLAHSGSRSLGHALAQRWHDRCADDEDAVLRYRGELAGCVRFAQANRALLVWQMLDAIGAARDERIAGTVDLVHNTVTAVGDDWVHRKGAAPADAGALTVTLGSRGTPSWLLRGSGDEAHLCSVAHGAGRRIARSQAKARLQGRYRREELVRSGGGEVLCDDPQLLWEEHPDTYKAVEPVVAAIERAGVASRVASMLPEVTVKR